MRFHLIPGMLLPASAPGDETLKAALSALILSASGWRTVFAPSGDEEDSSKEITDSGCTIAAAAARVFAEHLLLRNPHPVCLLGTDTRPTGPALATVLARVFVSSGIGVHYLAAVAAPEIMAMARKDENCAAFAYVSASHNPVGHNGFKFGFSDGAVLGGGEASRLIASFQQLISDRERIASILLQAGAVNQALLERLNSMVSSEKDGSRRIYFDFTREVVSGSNDPHIQDRLFTAMRDRTGSVAVLADFNGSARSLSIDRDILASAGVELTTIHDRPGEIAHRIVPEGVSLVPCMEELERLHRTDGRFTFGYVPDNDGDRGNLVYWDTPTEKARIVEAQEVFALAVAAELACSNPLPGSSGKGEKGIAVVVNGPTSRRIEAIAARFGARVFRCEVGEANVVGTAELKRREGYDVRILGEGSNGGNITHPSRVRDPIDTVFSLLKLLLLTDDPAPFRLWCEKSGNSSACREGFTVSDILSSLPVFTTTGAYEDEAMINLTAMDHGALKAAWEGCFLRDWEKRKEALASRWDIRTWEEVNYEGTEARHGFGPAFRTGKEKGGLAMLLKTGDDRVKATIWMRGSGTEPVFRVMVDVEGDDLRLHNELLTWHRAMVLEADASLRG